MEKEVGTARGNIEDNELPEDCIIRELKEETNQSANHVKYLGVMKFLLDQDKKPIYGVLFSAELDNMEPFSGNDEIEKIMLWYPEEDIQGADLIDLKLTEYFKD